VFGQPLLVDEMNMGSSYTIVKPRIFHSWSREFVALCMQDPLVSQNAKNPDRSVHFEQVSFHSARKCRNGSVPAITKNLCAG